MLRKKENLLVVVAFTNKPNSGWLVVERFETTGYVGVNHRFTSQTKVVFMKRIRK